MNIVTVHNKYQALGGEDIVFEQENALLSENGHSVASILFDNESIPERRSPLSSARLADCAPTWGVMITFGKSHSGLSMGSGSTSVTSTPAPHT